jgi:hypothetical protein
MYKEDSLINDNSLFRNNNDNNNVYKASEVSWAWACVREQQSHRTLILLRNPLSMKIGGDHRPLLVRGGGNISQIEKPEFHGQGFHYKISVLSSMTTLWSSR